MSGKFIGLSDHRVVNDEASKDIFDENEPRPAKVSAIKRFVSSIEAPKIKINLIERKLSDGSKDGSEIVIRYTPDIQTGKLQESRETVGAKGGWILPVGLYDNSDDDEDSPDKKKSMRAKQAKQTETPSERVNALPDYLTTKEKAHDTNLTHRMNDDGKRDKDTESQGDSEKDSGKSKKDKSRRKHKRKRNSEEEEEERHDSGEDSEGKDGSSRQKDKKYSKHKHKRGHTNSSSMEINTIDDWHGDKKRNSERKGNRDKEKEKRERSASVDNVAKDNDRKRVSLGMPNNPKQSTVTNLRRKSRNYSRDRSRDRSRNRSHDASKERSSRHGHRKSSRYEEECKSRNGPRDHRKRSRDARDYRERSTDGVRNMSREQSGKEYRGHGRNSSKDRRRSRSRDDRRSRSGPRSLARGPPGSSQYTQNIFNELGANKLTDQPWQESCNPEQQKLPDGTSRSGSPPPRMSSKSKERSVPQDKFLDRRSPRFQQCDTQEASSMPSNDRQALLNRSREGPTPQDDIRVRDRNSSPSNKPSRFRNSPYRYKERSRSPCRKSHDRSDSRSTKIRNSRSHSRNNDRSDRHVRSPSRRRGQLRSRSRDNRDESRRIRVWPEPHAPPRKDDNSEERRPDCVSRTSDRPNDDTRTSPQDETSADRVDKPSSRHGKEDDLGRRSPSMNSSYHGRDRTMDDNDYRPRWREDENEQFRRDDERGDSFFSDRNQEERDAWRGRGEYRGGGRGSWRGDGWRGREESRGDERRGRVGYRDSNEWRGRGGWHGDEGLSRGRGVWRGDGGFRGDGSFRGDGGFRGRWNDNSGHRGTDWRGDEWRGRGGWHSGSDNGPPEFPWGHVPLGGPPQFPSNGPPPNFAWPPIEFQGLDPRAFPPPAWPMIAPGFGAVNNQIASLQKNEIEPVVSDEAPKRNEAKDEEEEPRESSSAITVVTSQKGLSLSYDPHEPTGNCSPDTDTKEDRARDDDECRSDKESEVLKSDESKSNPVTNTPISDQRLRLLEPPPLIPNIHEPPPNFFFPVGGGDYRLPLPPGGGGVFRMPPPGFDAMSHRFPPRAVLPETGVAIPRSDSIQFGGPHRLPLLADPACQPNGVHTSRAEGVIPPHVVEGLTRHPIHPGGMFF